MKSSIAALLLLAFVGCSIFKLPVEQQNYLDKVNAEPTTFRMPRTTSNDAWGRAQVFVVQYANKEAHHPSEFVIETEHHQRDSTYDYKITRFNIGDQSEFTVTCTPPPSGYGGYEGSNAHIAAHFIRTGEMPYPQLLH